MLAVPQVLFPILDPLYEAVVDGFVRLDSDAYNGELEVIPVSFKMPFSRPENRNCFDVSFGHCRRIDHVVAVS